MRALLAAAVLGVTAASAASAVAATHTITIEGMKFAPATLTVKAGDTVTWNNKDVVPHTASTVATAKEKFDSGTIAAGKQWSWRAKGKGPHDYVCNFHPGMKGTVTVE